mmetsp:Transcript_22272/g.19786  ORF Transcript_22272/g.19786 Transcript_22272/m.19786 type:complete len:95 (+) Transcript_22272:724-1008(+)
MTTEEDTLDFNSINTTKIGRVRLMNKIKSYVDGILFAIDQNTKKEMMGTMLIKFFKDVTSEGIHMESHFYSDFEINRLQINKNHELKNVVEWQK